MKNNSKKSIVKYLSLFMLLVMLLAGCGNQTETKIASDSASEITSEPDTDAAAETKIYVPDTGYAEYRCEKEIDEDKIIYVQLDINPSFILGMTEDYKVVSITANNEDAEDVMINCMGDYFSEATEGIELENVIRDIAEATKHSGYIEDNFDVSVTVLSGEIEESSFGEAFESAANDLAENDGIEATIENFAVETDTYTESQGGDSTNAPKNNNDQTGENIGNDHNGQTGDNNDNDQGDEENGDNHSDQGSGDNGNDQNDDFADSTKDEDKTCDLCHGECTITCDLCNGEGTIIETEEREVQVRNDYVCPYCGGSGMLDDGMHGGQKAVCGHCGGEGKTGPMSGDFRELAFDTKIVEEEVERTCPRCNGEGTMDCPNCNGTGIIE